MVEPLAESQKVSMENREKLIRGFPLFSSLSIEESRELASLFQEVAYQANQFIVTQGDMVDSCYIIVSGTTEVTIRKPHPLHLLEMDEPVAVLHAGEAIGLNDTGIFSQTGQRTASVKALLDVLTLRLDLKSFHTFLKKYNLLSTIATSSQQMIRMGFIKQALPFSKLSAARLKWLADHVEEETIKAGTPIFKQGDPGDRCYLIHSGRVEIIIRDDNEKERRIAVLNPPALFGEATFITHRPRNATAIALEDTELLMLKHEYLSELVESQKNSSELFMTLMVDRSRPLRNPDIGLHQSKTEDGEDLTILKNPSQGAYFKLSKEGLFIWQQLDGKKTMQEITLNLADEFKVFAPNVVAGLLSKLGKLGFILNLNFENQGQTKGRFSKIKKIALRSVQGRFLLPNANRHVTKMYDQWVHYLFTKVGLIFFSVLSIIGAISFVRHTGMTLTFFNQHPVSQLLLFLLLPISLCEVVLHELGHAFAVKAFGREVHCIGIGIAGFVPFAFTDTSDMWLAKRKARMLVNLAGIYVDLLAAGSAALIIPLVANAYIASVLWLFALYIYLRAFRNLSPIQDNDGYFILMDFLEKNRLRHVAVHWLVYTFPKSIRHPALFREHIPEIMYWLFCLLFLICVTLITLMIQLFIFNIIGIKNNNIYFTLALPLLITAISIMTVFVEIRNQRD